MKMIKRILSLIMAVLLALTLLVFMPSCTSQTGQDTRLTSLEELAEHSDILSFVEYETYHERLLELEFDCLESRTYYHEYAEYPSAGTRPRLLVDEVQWYSIRYQSGEEEVEGYIAVPYNYLEKEYPVLIYNRGGYTTDNLRPLDLQYFARFGFIVLASKYRGSGGGTGKDGFGGEDVNDVIKLIDLAEEFAFTNGKMYMFGWSRGGMESYNVLSRDDRIDAAVAGAGPTDVSEFYFEEHLYTKKLENMIGGTPETHPEEYEARSAVCWPDKINTPLWIAHGTDDKTVLVHHSENLYNAMNALGKDVKLTLYPGMDHNDPYWTFLPDYFHWLKQH